MDGFVDAILGSILGAIVMYWLYGRFNRKKGKELVQHQSTIILDRIKRVCKLVSVEGDFAEIYNYENTKEGFLKMTSKKKALVLINAKAQVGYDLKKVKLSADTSRKTIVLNEFPQPEVLSVESDIKFYDIKNGLFNSFDSEDLTELNQQANSHIRGKIPESGLMETAKKEALEAVLIIEKIVETIGWKLDYSALELSHQEKNSLET